MLLLECGGKSLRNFFEFKPIKWNVPYVIYLNTSMQVVNTFTILIFNHMNAKTIWIFNQLSTFNCWNTSFRVHFVIILSYQWRASGLISDLLENEVKISVLLSFGVNVAVCTPGLDLPSQGYTHSVITIDKSECKDYRWTWWPVR